MRTQIAQLTTITLRVLLAMVAGSATVAGQESVCVDIPDNRLGFPTLTEGSNSFGGYSLTADGLEIFYDVWTNQPGPQQPVGVRQQNDWMLGWDCWIVRATRESVDKTFEGGAILKAPVNEDNAPRKAYGPRISADGTLLYFSAAFRDGGAGWWDIWVAERDDPAAPAFARVEPLPNVNAGGADVMGCVSPDGTELFFARSPHGVELRLWRARFNEAHKPLAGFRDLEKIVELDDGPWQVLGPTMSPDGRYLLWSDRPSGWPQGVSLRCNKSDADLWMAVRPSPSWDAPFGPPIRLPTVNDGSEQTNPTVWQQEGGSEVLLIYGQNAPNVASIRFGTDPEPRARFDYRPRFPVIADDVVFEANRSTVAAGDDIAEFQWSVRDIRDGQCFEDIVVDVELDYRFDAAGRYQVTLRTTTDGGHCDFVSEIVEVSEPDRRAFLRGDSDLSGGVNLTDPVFILEVLFGGGGALGCDAAADSNDDDVVNLTDATFLLNHLFTAGASPAAPFPECGRDPTPDELSCESFPSC